jgi:hypothetical protein
MDCLLKHVIERTIEEEEATEGRSRRCKQPQEGNEKIVEAERGNTRSHSVENLLWRRLWSCHKAGYGNETDN